MIEANLPAEQGAEQSVPMLSAMVGALLLSRSAQDPELSDPRQLLIEQSTASTSIEYLEADSAAPPPAAGAYCD